MLVPFPPQREGDLLTGALEGTALLPLGLLFRLKSLGRMHIAETLHVDRLDRHASAVGFLAVGAGLVAGILLALAEDVEGQVLSAHGVQSVIS